MRVAATGEELFRQRNDCDSLANCLTRTVQRTRAGGYHSGAAIGLLQPDAAGTGEDVLMLGFALASEGIVGRMLKKGAAEVGFRPEVGRRRESVECEIGSFRTFQRIVALIMDVREAGTTHAGGQRKQSDFAG